MAAELEAMPGAGAGILADMTRIVAPSATGVEVPVSGTAIAGAIIGETVGGVTGSVVFKARATVEVAAALATVLESAAARTGVAEASALSVKAARPSALAESASSSEVAALAAAVGSAGASVEMSSAAV
jgi:hypothetical protein